MTHEFLCVSMRGRNWIPCEVICRIERTNELTIRYFDDMLGWRVEANVEPEYVREKQGT